jgi:uncharacterized protein
MIYLDTCLVIYLVEEHPIYAPELERALSENPHYCISPLVEMECLVLPIKQNRHELIHKFCQFFAMQTELTMSTQVFHQAAQLRAQYGLKTPDALHLATAQHHHCTALWTNDNRLHSAAKSLSVNKLNEPAPFSLTQGIPK